MSWPRVWGSGLGLGVFTPTFKNFKFVPLMFLTVGIRAHIPLLRTIFHVLGNQIRGYKPYRGTEDNSLIPGQDYVDWAHLGFSRLCFWDFVSGIEVFVCRLICLWATLNPKP